MTPTTTPTLAPVFRPPPTEVPAPVPGWHVSTPPQTPGVTTDITGTSRPAPPVLAPGSAEDSLPPGVERPRRGLGPGHRPAPPLAPEESAPAPVPAAGDTRDLVALDPPPAVPVVVGVPGWVRVATTVAVVVVALVAAVVSYEHMRHVAAADAGEGWRSWLIPLSVDGLLVAASMVMLTRRRQGRPAGALAWGSLLLGIAASVAANVAAAEPTVVARLVAAWSPVALLLAVELLLQLLDHRAPSAVPTREEGDR